jgi:hypothetical protein
LDKPEVMVEMIEGLLEQNMSNVQPVSVKKFKLFRLAKA